MIKIERPFFVGQTGSKSLSLDQLLPLPAESKRNNNTSVIVGVSVSATLVIILVSGLAFNLRKIKKADVIKTWELDIGPHRFSYKELEKATRGFRDKKLLGFGGFGQVYKGTLSNSNTQVALK